MLFLIFFSFSIICISKIKINSGKVDNTINEDKDSNNLESFYNTLQIPILLSILYFIFQLPVFKKYIFMLIPSLFNKDGNQNIYGYIFYSILYGLSYIILTYIINRLNNI